MKLVRSDDKMSQLLMQLQSQHEVGSGSGSGEGKNDEPGDDEDAGEDEDADGDEDSWDMLYMADFRWPAEVPSGNLSSVLLPPDCGQFSMGSILVHCAL
ncbi:hypothetical protein Tco_1323936 [Tanacetum coccineum]